MMVAYDSQLYDQTQNLQGQLIQTALALFPLPPSTPPVLLQLRRGRAESPAWFLVQAAEFEPEPLSVERLRVRAIWSSERIVGALLELMATEKWLSRVGDDYHLLPEGHRLKTQLAERPARLLAQLQPLIRQTDLHRFESLLGRLIANATNCPTPPGNWCLLHSRRRAPSETDIPLLKIYQYFSDINAFRDDSHMAAWRPYAVPGFAWEAFNFVYHGQAHSADDLYDQLAYRGYSRQEYADGLNMLVERDWLKGKESGFQVSETGHTVHAHVETLTDQYFFAPWLQLDATEFQELHALFELLDLELKSLQPDHEKS